MDIISRCSEHPQKASLDWVTLYRWVTGLVCVVHSSSTVSWVPSTTSRCLSKMFSHLIGHDVIVNHGAYPQKQSDIEFGLLKPHTLPFVFCPPHSVLPALILWTTWTRRKLISSMSYMPLKVTAGMPMANGKTTKTSFEPSTFSHSTLPVVMSSQMGPQSQRGRMPLHLLRGFQKFWGGSHNITKHFLIRELLLLPVSESAPRCIADPTLGKYSMTIEK